MAVIMDGALVSQKTRARLAQRVAALQLRGITPGLAVVLVGEDVGSQVYVRNKQRACAALGIYAEQHTLPADTGRGELLALIARLNADARIHGILVQSPLPAHLDEAEITNYITPEKDVDAFHPFNVGRIMLGDYTFLPCTPAGIMELLAHYGIDPAGKHCVVVGRSHIVGKPMSMLMLHADATVTVCHSRTADLAAHTRRADILIVAAGRRALITGDMVKEGAVVIDVGMNRDEVGKLCGDVDFVTVEPRAGYLTPVPGGVGPMTITTLLQNTITAAENFGQKSEKTVDKQGGGC